MEKGGGVLKNGVAHFGPEDIPCEIARLNWALSGDSLGPQTPHAVHTNFSLLFVISSRKVESQ